MRLQPTGVDPRVRALPAHYKRAVVLEVGALVLEMSAGEAHDLADRLVDAAEKHRTPTTTKENHT